MLTLTPEEQANLAAYYAEKDLQKNDFKAFVELKKPIVKANFIIASKEPHSKKRLDFNKSMGWSIKEKYESVIFDCIQIGRELEYNLMPDDMCDAHWICGSPEFIAIFETITQGFDATGFELVEELNIRYTGSITLLGHTWHLMKHNILPKKTDKVYIGHGNECVLVTLSNYII